jgi:hypothetical protein
LFTSGIHHVDAVVVEHAATATGRVDGDGQQRGDDGPFAVQIQRVERGVHMDADDPVEDVGTLRVEDYRVDAGPAVP